MHWRALGDGQKGNPYWNGLIKQSKERVNGAGHFHFSLGLNLMVCQILCSAHTPAGGGLRSPVISFYRAFRGELMIYWCDLPPAEKRRNTHFVKRRDPLTHPKWQQFLFLRSGGRDLDSGGTSQDFQPPPHPRVHREPFKKKKSSPTAI